MAASIRKSGLEIENRCTDCPCFDLLAASIRKSGLEIKNRCTDYSSFDLCAAAIRKSGPEIENRCTEVPGMNLIVAAIAKSGPEIGNHCRAIVPASRMGPPTEGRCRYDDASDSNFRRRKVEWFRLQQTLPLRCRIRFQFSSSQSRTVPPA